MLTPHTGTHTAEAVEYMGLNVDTEKTCLRYQIACFAGAMTIVETVACMEAEEKDVTNESRKTS